MIFLHGEGGFLDELLIAVAAFAVLWIAVRLAGRRAAPEDEAELVDDLVSDEGAPVSRP